MKLYRIEQGVRLVAVTAQRKATAPSLAALIMTALEKGESFAVRDELEAIRAGKVMRDPNRRERARRGKREFVSSKAGAGVRIWRMK